MTARVIARDLDGTLLTPRQTLLPPQRSAITRGGLSTYHCHWSPSLPIHPFLSGAGAGNTCYLLQRHLFVYDYQAKNCLDADPRG